MILQQLKFSRRKDHIHPAQFACTLESFHSAETRRVAVVVADHDGRIQGLKVEDKYGIHVELGLRLKNQRLGFGRILFTNLSRNKNQHLPEFTKEHDSLPP